MILALLLLMLMPQDCTYDERCGNGMCMVWEHTRFVCEPKQYTVAVWDHECIEKIDAAAISHVEAPLVDGKPDKDHAKLIGAVVTFKKGCTWHYEVRNR